MSEAALKVRWPWVVVAVIGLCGALVLPVLSLKQEARPTQTLPSGRPDPQVRLQPTPQTKSKEGGGNAGAKAGHGHGRLGPEALGPVAAGPPGPPDPNASNEGAADDRATRSRPAITPEEIKQQLPGRFALSAPLQMQVGRSEHVTLVAGIEQLRSMVVQELQAVTGKDDAERITTKDLPLSKLLRIELRADSDADFEIKAFTPSDQRLSNQQATTWEWSVTPKLDGSRNLTVIISNLVDGQGQPIAVTIARRTVQVTLSWPQRIREVSGAASSAASALAGLIGTWMGLLKPYLARRRESEGKAASGKPDAAGDSPPPGDAKPPAQPNKPA